VWPALFLHEGAHCTKNCRMHLFINKWSVVTFS
jgi:hypothetical protein